MEHTIVVTSTGHVTRAWSDIVLLGRIVAEAGTDVQAGSAAVATSAGVAS